MNIIVTGSSGYVASNLIPLLKKEFSVFSVDSVCSNYCDLNASIDSAEFRSWLSQFEDEQISIVNLAAARFDYGATAVDYYQTNVSSQKKFLESLSNMVVKKFIHVSSVAAFDGFHINFSRTLSCDDAYRATKYIQESIIKKWCDDHNVELIVLYPSAIFSEDPRSDTNIGKLQSVSKFIPFIPNIEITKSLTYLPFFSKFIVDSVAGEISAGKYLTIENPSISVSKMIQLISGRSIKLVKIPFFSGILKIIANFLHVLGFFGRIDLKLTPNRVVKLFTDTSYSHVSSMDIDTETYVARNCEELPEILAKLSRVEK